MDLCGWQIREAGQMLYRIHGLILRRDWDTLRTLAVMAQDMPEDILFELNDYPGEMTDCTEQEFCDELLIYDWDAVSQMHVGAPLWFDGEPGDLSMECEVVFDGRAVKRVTLCGVHVF